ncbi:MAG TPA: phosphatidylglycerophosphatase A [Candidatus Magasanikbacteria bacterium]|nr:phosphatidylglycerophosphatase A [Candidatus Magasanikbacteria bacterium]
MYKFKGWLSYFIATGFFTGRLGRNGKGGGTWGSFLALFIQFELVFLLQPVWWVYPIITVGVFALGMLVVGPGERYAYERYGEVPRHDGKVGMYDRNETNIDEVFGMFVANLGVLMGFSLANSSAATLGNVLATSAFLVSYFFIFRYFDIYKPGPAKWVESKANSNKPFGVRTAFTIMADDFVAALIPFLGGLGLLVEFYGVSTARFIVYLVICIAMVCALWSIKKKLIKYR